MGARHTSALLRHHVIPSTCPAIGDACDGASRPARRVQTGGEILGVPAGLLHLRTWWRSSRLVAVWASLRTMTAMNPTVITLMPHQPHIVDRLLDQLERISGDLWCELNGPKPYLPVHQDMNREATRSLGAAEAVAETLEAVCGLPAATALAAYGLCDVAPCLECGGEAYTTPGDSSDGVDGWGHYGRISDGHDAVPVFPAACGEPPEPLVGTIRIRAALAMVTAGSPIPSP